MRDEVHESEWIASGLALLKSQEIFPYFSSNGKVGEINFYLYLFHQKPLW